MNNKKSEDIIKKFEGYVLEVDKENGIFKAFLLELWDDHFPELDKLETFHTEFLGYDEIRQLKEGAIFTYTTYSRMLDGELFEYNYKFRFVTDRINKRQRYRLKLFRKVMERYYITLDREIEDRHRDFSKIKDPLYRIVRELDDLEISRRYGEVHKKEYTVKKHQLLEQLDKIKIQNKQNAA